jgi:glucose/arabinose dehydrogenase
MTSVSRLLSLSLLLTGQALAASVPTGFIDRQIATGLTSPTALAVLPDERVLVVQQDGNIRIIKANALLPTNFHTFANIDSANERGCLGVVPDPAFATNHYVYFYCTSKVNSVSRNRVLRVTEANDVVKPGSERVIFELPDVPTTTKWHMGGAMRFGVDGKLYIAVGNHEDEIAPVANAHSQNLSTAFGKVLRINPNGTIPTNNPFYNLPGAYQAIYMYGLRNPFVFDIQPVTGLMLLGDVGQASWEEVNVGQAGGNYGWPVQEGYTAVSAFINPLFVYSHNDGCAITGAQFYNPTTAQFPASYVGKFLYADFCSGRINYFSPSNPAVVGTLASGLGNPTNIALSPTGNVYYLARNQGTSTPLPGAGTVGKISYTGSQAPHITQNPLSVTVNVGVAATFSVAADGGASVQWQRNGINISGATADSYTLAAPTVADNGANFLAIVTNAFGSVVSGSATLTVTSNVAPTARIDLPLADRTFSLGDVVPFSGSGTDPEDGVLAPSAFTWKVDIQHDAHAHTFVGQTQGISAGQFTVPAFEANEANMWLRITLTARDAYGATSTVTRDMFPRTPISQFALLGTPVNGWGPYEVDRSNGEQGAADGRPLTLSGVPYLKGLGVHAPSDLLFRLNPNCVGNFISDVGLDSEVGTNGSAIFQVYLDEVLAYDSGVLRGGDLRQTANVAITNKKTLRLVVQDAGDGNNFDHADWAGARISGCDLNPPVASIIANLTVSDGNNLGNWSVQNNLQVGDTVYGDRTYTVDSLPPALVGGNWLRAANASKKYAGTPLATFSLSAASDVYLALDNRAPLPAWVDTSWTDTATSVTTLEGTTPRTFSVFKKRFNSGTVSLGPVNNPSISMYLVVVK